MPRPRPITPEQGEAILSKYLAGESRNQLALDYGTSRRFITDYIRERGAVVRGVAEACETKLPYGNVFLNAEDNEAAAYWVGFLMADGCVSNPSGRAPAIILAIGGLDHGHTVKFSEFIGTNNAREGTAKSPFDGKILKTSRYVISSHELAKTLESYGVVERKSLIAKVSKNLEMNRHFWRGYVDGNGCLTERRHPKSEKIQLSGSNSIISQFESYCKSITSTKTKPYFSKGCWNFSVTGHHAIAIVRHMHDDCTIWLDRKRVTAEKIQPRPNIRGQGKRKKRMAMTSPRLSG